MTSHTSIDYRRVVEESQLVVDFRNATAGITDAGNICKL
jgi:hypothetical protein